MQGDVLQRHPDAPVALRQVGEPFALAVDHAAPAAGPHALETGVVGQVGHRIVIETDDFAEVDRGILDVLVLAELAVDQDQAVEFQAVKRLDLGGKGAGVVHRGLDEIVEVDRLHVERLAEVTAAVAQDLGDLRPIAGRVEARLDRVRTCRHLAERQKGRQNLDEDHIHEDGSPISPTARIRRSDDGFFRLTPASRSRLAPFGSVLLPACYECGRAEALWFFEGF